MDGNQINNKWTMVSPISGLEIDDILKNEIQIDRVTFISTKKLRYVLKRFSLPKKKDWSPLHLNYVNLFESNSIVGIIRFSGIWVENKSKYKKIIQEELHILISSLLCFSRRDIIPSVKICKSKQIQAKSFIGFNEEDCFIGTEDYSNRSNFALNLQWKKFHKQFYFLKALKIVQSKEYKGIKLDRKWIKTLKNALVLIGQSHESKDLAFCFLKNMIVIEMLLIEQGDKFKEKLPERIDAFLGWANNSMDDEFTSDINEIYSKRCQLVHEGKRDRIDIKDLIFSDYLVFNLLNNICKHINIFRSKKCLVNYSKQLQAERVLNLKPAIQPKTLQELKIQYEEEDYHKMQDKYY